VSCWNSSCEVTGLEVLRRMRGGRTKDKRLPGLSSPQHEEMDIIGSYDLGRQLLSNPVISPTFVGAITAARLVLVVLNEPARRWDENNDHWPSQPG